MTLIRQDRLVRVVLYFDDGSIELWKFPPERPAWYKESNNGTTQADPRNEEWLEHELFWRSDIRRPEVKPDAEGT